MMQLFVIQCSFQTKKDGTPIHGLAICSDADTPITFIYPNGKPLILAEIWKYNLKHHLPWAKFEGVL